MNHNQHIITSLGVLAVAFYLNLVYKWIALPETNGELLLILIIGIVYSMLPDIDQPGSIPNKYLTIGLVIIIIISFLKKLTEYGIIAAAILGIVRLVHHRTIIHSLLIGLLLSAPMYYLGFIYFLVAIISYTTHIVVDNDFSLGWEKDWKW